LSVQPLFFGEKLPRPVDCVTFEVIAEAKIPHHLEKGVVIGRASNVFDVASPQAFLSTGRASKFQLDIAQEMIFERIHSGRSKQNGGVPFWNQHIAGTNGVVLGGKKVEVLLADFVSFHCFFVPKEKPDQQSWSGVID